MSDVQQHSDLFRSQLRLSHKYSKRCKIRLQSYSNYTVYPLTAAVWEIRRRRPTFLVQQLMTSSQNPLFFTHLRLSRDFYFASQKKMWQKCNDIKLAVMQSGLKLHAITMETMPKESQLVALSRRKHESL